MAMLRKLMAQFEILTHLRTPIYSDINLW